MNISLTELLAAVKESVKEVEVCVPSRDYYARQGDFSTETISFVNGDELVHQLNTIAEGSRGEGPTELEMHRADYKACKDAGWESPGELLAAYKHLAEQDNAKQRKVDELIAELTKWKALQRKPWTQAEVDRVFNNSPDNREGLTRAGFRRLVRHIEACQGLEGTK